MKVPASTMSEGSAPVLALSNPKEAMIPVRRGPDWEPIITFRVTALASFLGLLIGFIHPFIQDRAYTGKNSGGVP